jgi:type II secretory pathway pseudopilin PulG
MQEQALILNKETGEKQIAGHRKEAGFSMIEAIIAIFILSIGLLTTAAAVTYALEFSTISRNASNAKNIIMGSIEEIENLRNTRKLSFSQIANVGGVNNTGASYNFSGFSTDWKRISLNPGQDGINGTDDDLIDAGGDGVFGTADDFENPAWVRSGFQRQITITRLSPSLKKIEVKVRYFSTGNRVGELTGISYLNDDTHTAAN